MVNKIVRFFGVWGIILCVSWGDAGFNQISAMSDEEEEEGYVQQARQASSDDDYDPDKDEEAPDRGIPAVDQEEAPASARRPAPRQKRPRMPDYEESENEEEEVARIADNVPEDFENLVIFGTQVKLLANVYLRDCLQKANVFIPRYAVDNGPWNYFMTGRGQICVFVSGGLQHAWEKTVAYVFRNIFGQNIKIIRAHWMDKPERREDPTQVGLAIAYEDREEELHSELYFDYYFRHSFELPELKPGQVFKIQAFSWWDVCDNCHTRLGKLKDRLPRSVSLNYEVVSCRRLKHTYQVANNFRLFRAAQVPEQQAWNTIWARVQHYVNSYPDHDTPEKKEFWSTTKGGLEVCKWLAQAFSEDSTSSKKRGPKGDVLRYFDETNQGQVGKLKELLVYLKAVNWDLSCWFRDIPYDGVQPKWGRHWCQVVMPHFDWKIIDHLDDQSAQSTCQMCGKRRIRHVSRVYHPKYRVSKTRLSELTYNQRSAETLDSLTESDKKGRKRALWVGSECVQVLRTTKEEIDKWREGPYKEQKEKMDQDRALEEAMQLEKEKKKEKNKKKIKSLNYELTFLLPSTWSLRIF